MPEDLVVLKSFATEFEAESAKATLDAEGIPAMLRSDAAAVHPMVHFTAGIQLIVRQRDAEAASAILNGESGDGPSG